MPLPGLEASIASMGSGFEFLLLAVVSLLAIVNPFSAVPVFLAITPHDSVADRIRMARIACLVGTVILAIMAVAGQWIFSILGITLPALQIAGGIVLFAIGFEMLRAPDSDTRLNQEEREIAARQQDIAVTPLAVPLLCGPGSISTVIILQTQAESFAQSTLLLLSVLIVYGVSYGILHLAASGTGWLNPIVLRVLRRVMGLLFAVIAAQFVINGLSALPILQN